MKNINKILSLFESYGVIGSLKIILDLIYTKLFFRRARLIRRPIFVRGKKNIKIEKGFTTGRGCRIETFTKGTLIIGENCQINDNVDSGSVEKIIIGINVLIASKVFITDHNHGNYSEEDQDSPNISPIERKLISKPVYIEDNVWIGEMCSILPGVTIGEGSIIGSNSLVSKNIPSYSIAVGNPAKIIKRYDKNSKKWEKIL